MEPFDSIISNTKDFKSRVIEVVTEELLKNETAIIEMNIKKIHFQGKTINNTSITRRDKDYPIYSEPYTRIKTNLGIYQGFIDLTLDGEYLRSYKMRIEGTLIYIEGEKTVRGFDLANFIREKYGDVEGLSDKDWQEVAEEFLTPKINDEILTIW